MWQMIAWRETGCLLKEMRHYWPPTAKIADFLSDAESLGYVHDPMPSRVPLTIGSVAETKAP